MKINLAIVAIAIIAVLGFVYFVITRNRKDQRDLEKELNQKESPIDKHSSQKN